MRAAIEAARGQDAPRDRQESKRQLPAVIGSFLSRKVSDAVGSDGGVSVEIVSRAWRTQSRGDARISRSEARSTWAVGSSRIMIEAFFRARAIAMRVFSPDTGQASGTHVGVKATG